MYSLGRLIQFYPDLPVGVADMLWKESRAAQRTSGCGDKQAWELCTDRAQKFLVRREIHRASALDPDETDTCINIAAKQYPRSQFGSTAEHLQAIKEAALQIIQAEVD